MRIEFRLAGSSDIPRVSKIFATAIDDISRRHGFLDEPTPSSPPNPLYAFWLKKNPRAFWVAEDQGRVVGYTFSFLRGPLWYLADLFILPEYQGKGIGGALIEKTLGSWKNRMIANKALITPAFNRASVSLYMRHGMLPRQPVYAASAPKDEVMKSLGRGKIKLEMEEVRDFGAWSSQLAQLHRQAMGFPSGWHNEFFFEVLKAKCLVLRRRGHLEGYSFVRQDGRIGPLVVKSASSFTPAFESAMRVAVETEGERISMFFPGTNGAAASESIRYGFKIEYPLLFLSSRPMGDFENYLFHSPGLM